MLRDPSLVPLSRQHQHALALCVRIDRALAEKAIQLSVWQIEIQQSYEHEISGHFVAEESVLFPVARRFSELALLVDDLLSEHQRLREHFARADERTMDRDELGAFAKLLSGHIRKEERLLFEGLQKVMPKEEMSTLGKALEVTERSCRIRR